MANSTIKHLEHLWLDTSRFEVRNIRGFISAETIHSLIKRIATLKHFEMKYTLKNSEVTGTVHAIANSPSEAFAIIVAFNTQQLIADPGIVAEFKTTFEIVKPNCSPAFNRPIDTCKISQKLLNRVMAKASKSKSVTKVSFKDNCRNPKIIQRCSSCPELNICSN